jgi:UDP-2-acetamido-2,6-beta-L-arabino-hexul-4-ose reductase
MNLLVTGSEGFLGKNLREFLRQNRPEDDLLFYDVNTGGNLASLCEEADFVFHLAGVNRPGDPGEFETGNAGLTREVLRHCGASGKNPPVLLSSSVQAELDNPYGKSKKAAEEAVFA